MSKFKVNENVISVENGKSGVIRARDIVHDGKMTEVKYMVDFGGGMNAWKVMEKKDLKRASKKKNVRPYIVREYDHENNQKLIVAAAVKTKKFLVDIPDTFGFCDGVYERKGKTLSIGFAIYNGTDDYDFNVGRKHAIHRMKHNPFTVMESKFGGEFNYDTVVSIMDTKAKYIKEHWNEFYRPRN